MGQTGWGGWRQLGLACWARHRDDTPWNQAPLPRRRHTCEPHTVAVLGYGIYREVVERCACGAIRRGGALTAHWTPNGGGDIPYRPGPHWTDRNCRRKRRTPMVTTL